MKNLTMFLMAVIIVIAISKLSDAQNADTASYKYKLTKTWYYNYSKNFGVVTQPDSTQKNDKIVFKPDMTYQMTIDGVSSSGIWNVSESSHFLTLSDSKTKQSRTVKIVGLIKDQLDIKWQAPDLTSEYKYFYTK